MQMRKNLYAKIETGTSEVSEHVKFRNGCRKKVVSSASSNGNNSSTIADSSLPFFIVIAAIVTAELLLDFLFRRQDVCGEHLIIHSGMIINLSRGTNHF